MFVVEHERGRHVLASWLHGVSGTTFLDFEKKKLFMFTEIQQTILTDHNTSDTFQGLIQGGMKWVPLKINDKQHIVKPIRCISLGLKFNIGNQSFRAIHKFF